MITDNTYHRFDEAIKYFNDKLFEGKLPDILLTLNRMKRTRGYHHFEKFQEREGKKRISEIALNPDSFEGRSDEEVLSTLVHELCHHWQWSFGKPSRPGYHDREWASKMDEIGLCPTSTGEIEGKRTGQRMTHIIVDGGKFEIACKAFLLKGSALYLNSVVEPKIEKERKKTREKFCCPTCLQAVWAKKTANIMCGDCEEKMVVEDE